MLRAGRLAIAGVLAALPMGALAEGPSLTVKAVNRLDIARPSETLELSAKDLAPIGEKDLHKIHVTDAAGKERLCQAVDTDGDLTADQVLFQSDFGPNETQTFKVSAGAAWKYKKDDFRAYGRFNRERFDDFAWENDRTAHRMYGKALETWQAEPLTSSTVDIWVKSTPHMIQNDWYMIDNYHSNTGEGADFYSAGATRGVGGTGLWAGEKMWLSKNFVATRTLAQGPIRVLFELIYDAYDVNGTPVSEVKRISLDAGQNLNRFQNTYKPASPAALTAAIGIRKADVTQKETGDGAWYACWEPIKKGAEGNLATAVVSDPKFPIQTAREDDKNFLYLAKVPADTLVYWAGGGWDRSGHVADFAAWKTYVDRFARGLRSPIEVSVTAP
jgi:pectinesterase